jgi:hypothetical protein
MTNIGETMKKLIALIAISIGLAHAGDMKTDIDTLTGEQNTYFIGVNRGMIYHLTKFDADTVALRITPRNWPAHPNHCDRHDLLLKTVDSKIYTLNTSAFNLECYALVNYSLVKNSAIVRVPMFHMPSIDVTIDTTNLDWAAMGKRKITK